MMSCCVVRRHLDALVDGELDTTVQVEFDSHLSSCPVCREHASFSRTIKREIKRSASSVRAPESLRLRLVQSLAEAEAPLPARAVVVEADSEIANEHQQAIAASRPWKVSFMPARYAVPAAAAAVFFVVAGQSDRSADQTAFEAAALPMFEEVVQRHSSEHPAEVHGQPQEMARWFQGRLGFPVHPVEFAPEDREIHARLIGARLSRVRDRDAAAFYYEVNGRRITMLIFEPPPNLRQRLGTGLDSLESVVRRARVRGQEVMYRQVRGYTVPVVEHAGLAYAFTGDLDSQSMLRLAAAAHPVN